MQTCSLALFIQVTSNYKFIIIYQRIGFLVPSIRGVVMQILGIHPIYRFHYEIRPKIHIKCDVLN